MTVDQPRSLHLAAHFPGAGGPAAWSDSPVSSQIDFASFEHLARTAERGLFDFFFLAEGLRLREHKGLVHDLDVAGRPESITLLNALAAVTDRLGLAATVNVSFNEPYELARRLSSLDHLSSGRAGWNVVTSSDAFTGENFRRGGCPDRVDRYTRAAEFIATARELWDSWTPDGQPRPIFRSGQHFAVQGEFTVPRSPQGHPVVIQSGDSDEGREFAAAFADVAFTRHGTLDAGRAFYADVKARLAAYGRQPSDLKIMPGVTFVLGASDAEARERAAAIRHEQISPERALLVLEQVWGRDLSSYDPDGPLPEIDPEPDVLLTQGLTQTGDPLETAARWRELSRAKGLSIRQTVIEATTGQSFVGTARSIASAMADFVSQGAADGFLLVPHLTPGDLDEFVDEVVPLLQERGVFRTCYSGTTLRAHLGLAQPVWKG
ncbi:NtaA/DmoA family FMN-dependent monooxygenase [Streptomyces albipurpureus]|uniref:NtaA/DmoA family FMN-dependent monooxygenase n=1 Tax=Streptomyces albipurpureus TaxID=2897419 RepID=A0ABT0URL6_9ACTN|nr:NtaA/DmoA family FMN-dependent monooxygenase [Streptomyces sp. CWNU-1]MCM2390265.1 NtaA/DmoA family FMN-dependent monooxygenase [Streptomyces sp. CWNU-1]